jgi:hypothetical protein
MAGNREVILSDFQVITFLLRLMHIFVNSNLETRL